MQENANFNKFKNRFCIFLNPYVCSSSIQEPALLLVFYLLDPDPHPSFGFGRKNVPKFLKFFWYSEKMHTFHSCFYTFPLQIITWCSLNNFKKGVWIDLKSEALIDIWIFFQGPRKQILGISNFLDPKMAASNFRHNKWS